MPEALLSVSFVIAFFALYLCKVNYFAKIIIMKYFEGI